MTQPFGVVTSGDEQRHRSLDPDAMHSNQLWGGLVHELSKTQVEVGELVGECLPASGQGVERVAVRAGRVGWCTGPPAGHLRDKHWDFAADELLTQLVRRRVDERVDLVRDLSASLHRRVPWHM